MGGCRCSYKNCKNTTKTTDNVHFFHYPVKHKERCKIWIEYANKPQFCDLEEDQLRNKVICEYHFEDRWFPNSQKKRLLQGAVPTLDAGCGDDPPPPQEAPLYLSSQLQDVQVLPANEDGTIFVLDTDTMFSRSQKVESYIYKNGVIVPANSKQVKPTLTTSKPSTSTSNNTVYCSFKDNEDFDSMPNSSRAYGEERTNDVLEESPEYKVIIKNEAPEFNENTTSINTVQQNTSQRIIKHSMEKETYEAPEQEDIYETSNPNSAQRRPIPRSGTVKNMVSKSVIEKSVGRNYLRKIKQHSRDIASIKRMLKQKALAENKPDINSVLNSLQEHLPPTFFTILNLNLNNKCELNDDDVDFFTTVHKTSPEVYQLLIDKYKWNLPCVDIVESSME